MKKTKYITTNLITLSLLLSLFLVVVIVVSNSVYDDDDDIALLQSQQQHEYEEENTTFPQNQHLSDDDDSDVEDGLYSDYEDGYDDRVYRDDVAFFDDADVVVLSDRNFSRFVDDNRYVMVEFYAPWCGHCKALAPEYAAAATELKELREGNDVAVMAKVDGSVERGLAEEYGVEGFPNILFFVDGEHVAYTGHRTKDAIVTWIKKKIGPGVYNITTTEDAERLLTSVNKVVLAFLDSLVGPMSEELAAASKSENDVNFYQTVNPNVAKLFHMDPDAKRPIVIMLKREEEKVNIFDGQFVKSAIAEFVSANKLPLVTSFTKDTAPLIFESPIKKQLLLFATSKNSKKVIPTFQEAAKWFKGKLIFVYIEMDDEEVGKPVAEFFGVTGNSPQVIGYMVNDKAKKFIFEGDVTLNKIKVFGENFVQDKLKPFYKSDPVPETNDGDIKVVVGNNFDEVVLDETKDVLLEVYAPWCGHCQNLEPTYNKLAKHLHGIESLVIAKMDGTTNEHPSAKADGFPTLLFFPAGKKNSDPITVDSDHTVVALFKFLKKHASIPFKLQKPAATPIPKGGGAKGNGDSSTNDLKDEL